MAKAFKSSSFKEVFASFCDFILLSLMTEEEKIRYELSKDTSCLIDESYAFDQFPVKFPEAETNSNDESNEIKKETSNNINNTNNSNSSNSSSSSITSALNTIFAALSESVLSKLLKQEDQSIVIDNSLNTSDFSVKDLESVGGLKATTTTIPNKNDLASAFKLIFSSLSEAIVKTMITDEEKLSYFMNEENCFIVGGPIANGVLSFERKTSLKDSESGMIKSLLYIIIIIVIFTNYDYCFYCYIRSI